MSRDPNSSSWADNRAIDCQQSSSTEHDSAEFGHETPNSQATFIGYRGLVDWIIQLGQSVLSPFGTQVHNKQEVGRGSLPRFLFLARTLSRDEKLSAIHPVEWIRDSLLRFLPVASHRTCDDSPGARSKPEGELIPQRLVGPVDGKSTRTKRTKDRTKRTKDRTKRTKDRSELPEHLVTGSQGEQLALDYLRRKGWKLIDRNVRAVGGEIDLVMLDQQTIVFVEVKTWGSATDEDPAEAVDLYKQRTLTRAGLTFLRKKRWLEKPARFDVVSVRISERGSVAEQQSPTLRHFRSAFESQGDSFFG